MKTNFGFEAVLNACGKYRDALANGASAEKQRILLANSYAYFKTFVADKNLYSEYREYCEYKELNKLGIGRLN